MYAIAIEKDYVEFLLFNYGPWHIPEFSAGEKPILFQTKREAKRHIKENKLRNCVIVKKEDSE